jgi:type IV secretion system protein VirD4
LEVITIKKPTKNALITAVVMGAFVFWIGLLIGKGTEGASGVAEVFARLEHTLDNPFEVSFTFPTVKTALGLLGVYAVCMLIYFSTRQNLRPGEEHGSAAWGVPAALTKSYRDRVRGRPNPLADTILTSKVRVGRNGTKSLANLNVLCIGGPGSGKSYMFVKPNMLQMNGSYIISDPKGELLRDIAPALIAKGIEITVLNLVDMSCSDCYNPFEYIRTDADALKLITNLIKNTTPRGSSSSEPFWEKAETALLLAFVLYLKHEAPIEEQNFSVLMEMIEGAAAKEEDENYRSPADVIFDELESREPGHIAVREYKVFKQAAGKTAKSILVSAAVRLAAFNLPNVARVTRRDEMRLGELGSKQRYIFCVIPDADTSLNYIVGMLYTQAFQELYRNADNQPSGKLTVPVRVMMDEFANVALPDDFERILSTCRGREIYINIIIQNIAQLKALFKDGWETITGDCAILLYLGGNEHSTHEYISKMLGKETIDTRTRGISRGRSGGSSTNYQNVGRELLAPDEVRTLDKNKAIVLIQGESPVIDLKYKVKRHPHYNISALGKAKPYSRTPVTVTAGRDIAGLSDEYKLEIISED